jgi:hypothetical protein
VSDAARTPAPNAPAPDAPSVGAPAPGSDGSSAPNAPAVTAPGAPGGDGASRSDAPSVAAPGTPRNPGASGLDAPTLRRAFVLALALVSVLLALYLVPVDDALRHVGVAFADGRAWGDVYPHSEFARFPLYNPWWGYDAALRVLGDALAALPLDRLARQFLALKLLSTLWIGAFLWCCTRRARIAARIADARTFLVAVGVTALLLSLPLQRFAAARPFAFGTLFLLYAVGRAGAWRGFASAALLTALYPYLAWMYVAAAALAHVWRGSRAFALGALAAGTIGVVAFRPGDLVGLLGALVHAGTVRADLWSTFRITELEPLWHHPFTLGMYMLVAAWFAPRLGREARRLRTEHVIAACFLPASLVHARYFVDVVVPLLFVAHGAEAVGAASATLARLAARPRGGTPDAPGAPDPNAMPSGGRGYALRALLAIACVVVLGALVVRSAEQHRNLARTERALAPLPRGARILTEFNLQYRVLYARPDLSLVPSSELGFPHPDIRDAYVAYIAHGRACTLAERVDAAYLVNTPSQRLAPDDRACLEALPPTASDLRVWRVRHGPGASPARGAP